MSRLKKYPSFLSSRVKAVIWDSNVNESHTVSFWKLSLFPTANQAALTGLHQMLILTSLYAAAYTTNFGEVYAFAPLDADQEASSGLHQMLILTSFMPRHSQHVSRISCPITRSMWWWSEYSGSKLLCVNVINADLIDHSTFHTRQVQHFAMSFERKLSQRDANCKMLNLPYLEMESWMVN